MSNFLDLICPQCMRTDCIEVAAHIWLRVTEDGTDPDLATQRDHEYHPQSPAICSACGFAGVIRDFEQEAAL